ncbi:hypothetical protein MMIC_P1579 [Mariprofundus micogutta]|uniref:Uncharacterized protein n=1 Tax=Mariprofundus micogutta TaxID=1921010 RepID=A0A1L8CNY1_9PROT|nr:hypothetical protein [Mariprofundus micogutta]GAV20607.1 hypothetical protein MMIC_P1579 [Mariprofundus micogutta]
MKSIISLRNAPQIALSIFTLMMVVMTSPDARNPASDFRSNDHPLLMILER